MKINDLQLNRDILSSFLLNKAHILYAAEIIYENNRIDLSDRVLCTSYNTLSDIRKIVESGVFCVNGPLLPQIPPVINKTLINNVTKEEALKIVKKSSECIEENWKNPFYIVLIYSDVNKAWASASSLNMSTALIQYMLDDMKSFKLEPSTKFEL